MDSWTIVNMQCSCGHTQPPTFKWHLEARLNYTPSPYTWVNPEGIVKNMVLAKGKEPCPTFHQAITEASNEDVAIADCAEMVIVIRCYRGPQKVATWEIRHYGAELPGPLMNIGH